MKVTVGFGTRSVPLLTCRLRIGGLLMLEGFLREFRFFSDNIFLRLWEYVALDPTRKSLSQLSSAGRSC